MQRLTQRWFVYGSWLLELPRGSKEWNLLIEPLIDNYTFNKDGLSVNRSFWIADGIEETIKDNIVNRRLIDIKRDQFSSEQGYKLHNLGPILDNDTMVAELYLVAESIVTCNQGIKNGQMYLDDLLGYDNTFINSSILKTLLAVEKMKS